VDDRTPPDPNEWVTPDHALAYLDRADEIPHRREGEAVVLELLPVEVRRFLDLGTGDGRLLALVKGKRPGANAVGLDLSPTMLEAAHARFGATPKVSLVKHDLSEPLPDLGSFDLVVSSFAIHHLNDERKRELYEEVFQLLDPGGVFANLEHVASPTPKLHEDFYRALGMGVADEDPSNRCLALDVQVRWLGELGFEDVDCFWKWRELALIAGTKPKHTARGGKVGGTRDREPRG
jgi:tRNA (cmo5U34)-methyltransferase